MVGGQEDLEDSQSCCCERCGEGDAERACDNRKQELRGESEGRGQTHDLALKQRRDDVSLKKMHEGE